MNIYLSISQAQRPIRGPLVLEEPLVHLVNSNIGYVAIYVGNINSIQVTTIFFYIAYIDRQLWVAKKKVKCLQLLFQAYLVMNTCEKIGTFYLPYISLVPTDSHSTDADLQTNIAKNTPGLTNNPFCLNPLRRSVRPSLGKIEIVLVH